MNFIFCNINEMDNYQGITIDDQPKHEGNLVKDTSDVFEQDNFLDFNGRCYGYVRTGGEIHLDQHFKGVSEGTKSMSGITVVFCAAINEEELTIVGWYENATVFKEMVTLPLYDDEYLYFNFMADAKDCHLISKEDRDFIIKRPRQTRQGKTMGKSNLWYAKSAYGRGDFIPRVMDEIQRDDLNFVPVSLEDKINQMSLTLEEGNNLILGHEAYDEEEDFLAAAYFLRALEKEESYDAYLGLAKSYEGAQAYSKALEVLEKMMSLYGEDEELINEAFSISDFILDYERASLYYKKQKSYADEEIVQEEYYAYINELEDLVKSFGAYLKK